MGIRTRPLKMNALSLKGQTERVKRVRVGGGGVMVSSMTGSHVLTGKHRICHPNVPILYPPVMTCHNTDTTIR